MYCPLRKKEPYYEGYCKEKRCPFWIEEKERCGISVVIQAIDMIAEKLPNYGKPTIINTTEKEGKLTEARGVLAERIDAKKIMLKRAQEMVSYARGKPDCESWRDQITQIEDDLIWMNQLYERCKP